MNFKKAEKKTNLSSNTSINSINSIVKGTIIKGEIKSYTDIRIDGVITGNVNCEAKVIIGETGVVEGDIVCKSATIEGKFKGTLRVKEQLSVKEKAVVEGDINIKQLVVQPGAIFNGNCTMGGTQSQSNGILSKARSSKLASSL